MSRRALKSDTPADETLRECINAFPPQSFVVVAGAGSGKTTTLIKGLMSILESHAAALRQRRQRVACITYTDVAAGEIWADVGNNPLVHVSTIHSFLWSVIRGFQPDIQLWVASRLDEKLADLKEKVAGFGPRVQQRTRDKAQADIARFEGQKIKIEKVRSFSYGTGSNYPKGILGHDDIIKMVPQLLHQRPLLRVLVAQQFPFIFVDESQDTTAEVVLALKAIDQHMGDKFCLGFFGDPVQRIYPTGIGVIPLEDGWRNITKPENFRCPLAVLDVANRIRRDADGLIQTRGRTTEKDGEQVSVVGAAHIFFLQANDQRVEALGRVRQWAARTLEDDNWLKDSGTEAAKQLVIVHRMAATRLGFADLYASLNDGAPESFKGGFVDGSAWPLRPFVSFVVPLVRAHATRRDFDVIQLLRRVSPLLAKENLGGVSMADRLAELSLIVDRLAAVFASPTATVGEALRTMHDAGLYTLDQRVLSYMNVAALPAEENEVDTSDEEDEEDLTKEIQAMSAFLACPAKQLMAYQTYYEQQSPFATQQGIKGTEYENVLVVLDDDEGTHTQFSYDKLFGIKPLSDRDQANLREGLDNVVERTRRLFYVCCTRSLKNLVVVLFAVNPSAAKVAVERLNLFPEEALHTEEDL